MSVVHVNSQRRFGGSILGLALAVGCACAVHEARPAFRRSVALDDRGISVPLPPPSFIKARTQRVDVEGTLPGSEALLPGTVLHMEDLLGEGETAVEVASDAFRIEDFELDLQLHCLELWLTAPDGRQSSRVQVHATVVDEHTLRTDSGCADD